MPAPLRLAAAALAALALAAPAAAQEPHRVRVGVGVGVTAFDLNAPPAAAGFPAGVPDSIYFTVDLTPSFRLEPQVGVSTFDQDAGANPSVRTSLVAIGLGAFWVRSLGAPLDLYLGARFVRIAYEETLRYSTGDVTTSGTDLRVAPAVGGEYAVHPRFSIGAEVQVAFVSFGSRTQTGGAGVPGGSGVQTAGLLFARLYPF